MGDWHGDPGSGWDVCGDGSKDHTLVRKSSVTSGNLGDWDGTTTAENCEWEAFPQNTWDYLGSHTMTVTSDECAGTYDDCGVCDGDNTSCRLCRHTKW